MAPKQDETITRKRSVYDSRADAGVVATVVPA
jgi:hypothetical protein